MASPENASRSEEHTSELQSLTNLVCRLLLEKKKITDEATIDAGHGYRHRPRPRGPPPPAQTAPRASCDGPPACTTTGRSISLFFLRIRAPPRSTLFPSTPPFH